MSKDDEKAAIEARLIDQIKSKEPGWQLASLGLFLWKASELPMRGQAEAIEKVTNTAPDASPPIRLSSVERSSPTPQAAQRATPALTYSEWMSSALSDLSWMSSSSTRILSGLTSLSRTAVIGRDVERATEVAIGELERCGGLYVLGQPRTGKSNLLISLALADIQSGHGILFIDPPQRYHLS